MKRLSFLLTGVILFFSLLCCPGAANDDWTREFFLSHDGRYEYAFVEENAIEITSHVSTLEEITIPAILDGYPVVSIGEFAFSNLSSLRAVRIPEGVISIGQMAFYDCFSLQSIRFPDSLRTIDQNAFSGCDALLEVTLPEGLSTLGDGAFSRCKSLRTIRLPASLETIGSNPFAGCIGLEKIDVAPFSPWLETSDGLLYHKEQKTLLCCPGGLAEENVRVKEGTEIIGENAFSGCIFLTEMILPDTVTRILSDAISDCVSLQRIYYVEDIPEMETDGFFNFVKHVFLPFSPIPEVME